MPRGPRTCRTLLLCAVVLTVGLAVPVQGDDVDTGRHEDNARLAAIALPPADVPAVPLPEVPSVQVHNYAFPADAHDNVGDDLWQPPLWACGGAPTSPWHPEGTLDVRIQTPLPLHVPDGQGDAERRDRGWIRLDGPTWIVPKLSGSLADDVGEMWLEVHLIPASGVADPLGAAVRPEAICDRLGVGTLSRMATLHDVVGGPHGKTVTDDVEPVHQVGDRRHEDGPLPEDGWILPLDTSEVDDGLYAVTLEINSEPGGLTDTPIATFVTYMLVDGRPCEGFFNVVASCRFDPRPLPYFPVTTPGDTPVAEVPERTDDDGWTSLHVAVRKPGFWAPEYQEDEIRPNLDCPDPHDAAIADCEPEPKILHRRPGPIAYDIPSRTYRWEASQTVLPWDQTLMIRTFRCEGQGDVCGWSTADPYIERSITPVAPGSST